MTHINIRPAEASDAPTIVSFNQQLARETENIELDHEVISRGVATALADPSKARYLVAYTDTAVVGQLMHTREWSDWRNGDIWWLQSVFVEPDFRRQGIFTMLYHHLHRMASQDPTVVGLRLYVERENTRAHKVYEQLGMSRAGYFVMQDIFSGSQTS